MPKVCCQLNILRSVGGIPTKISLWILLNFLDKFQRKHFCFLYDLDIAMAAICIWIIVVNGTIASNKIFRVIEPFQPKTLATWKGALEKFKAIQIALVFLNFTEFSQVLANIIANSKFSFWCDNLIIFLVLELLSTEGIIAFDLPALLLVSINLRELENFIAEPASDSKRLNNLSDNSTGSSDPDIFVATRAIFIELQPIFYTSLAK